MSIQASELAKDIERILQGPMLEEGPSFKAPDIEKPVKCLYCGRFCETIKPDKATVEVPVGHYCKWCKWHSAQKCRVEEVLQTDLIEIAKLAPNNPVIRAQIMAKCLHQVPENLKDWPSIKSWIEFTLNPPKSVTPVYQDNVWGAPTPLPTRDARTVFNVQVRRTDTEVGHCRYTVSRSGRQTYPITREDIIECLRSSNSESEAFTELRDFINQQVSDNPPDMDATGEYDYDHYDMSDDGPDDEETRIDWAQVREMFEEALRSDPTLAAAAEQ